MEISEMKVLMRVHEWDVYEKNEHFSRPLDIACKLDYEQTKFVIMRHPFYLSYLSEQTLTLCAIALYYKGNDYNLNIDQYTEEELKKEIKRLKLFGELK